MPPELWTFFIGMTPIGEVRAAIPIGMGTFHLSAWSAFFWGSFGNIVAMVVLVLLLPRIVRLIERHSKFFHRILQGIFEKTHKKHSKNFQRFEAVLLLLISSTPIPILSGAYTVVIIAWLFGVKPRVAILMISIGIIIAGALVAGLISGGEALFRFF